jgi:hypothetical protein
MLIKNEKTGVVFVVPKINTIAKVGKKFVAGTDIGIFSLNIDVENGYVETIYDEILNSYVFTPSKIPIKHEKFLGITPFNLDEIMKKFQKRINVNYILEISENNVLIGTGDGLVLFNLLNKKYKIYYPINKHITIITKDNHNRIWVGTKAGISIFYFIGEELKLYKNITIHSKLPSGMIKSIVPYKDEIYIGTDVGICRIKENLLIVDKEKHNITGGCIGYYDEILFTTEDANLIRFRKDERVEIFRVEGMKYINALTPLSSNKIAVCGDVVGEINMESLEVSIYKHPHGRENLTTLYYDKENDFLIIGSYFFGIYIKKGDKIFGEDAIHWHFGF